MEADFLEDREFTEICKIYLEDVDVEMDEDGCRALQACGSGDLPTSRLLAVKWLQVSRPPRGLGPDVLQCSAGASSCIDSVGGSCHAHMIPGVPNFDDTYAVACSIRSSQAWAVQTPVTSG